MNFIKKVVTTKIGLGILALIFSTVGLVLLIGMVFTVLVIGIAGGSNSEHQQQQMGSNFTCSPTGQLDEERFLKRIDSAGAFAGKGELFLKIADEWGIDPVLFAAIAMLETGNGTSNALVNKNNPGGLKIKGQTHHFSTLEEGMNSMGKTLNTQVIKLGRTTVEELGKVYAPVGDPDDIHQTNSQWAVNVNKFAEQFGGLIMNCEQLTALDIVGDFVWPLPFTKSLTSGYGMRTLTVRGETVTRLHAGVDIASIGVEGQSIVAFASGTVVSSGTHDGLGNFVKIDHGNGMQTLYGHMLELGVPKGTNVSAGDVIGKVGSTGRSTGAHLHFEIHIDGQAVDPLPHLTSFITTDRGGNR